MSVIGSNIIAGASGTVETGYQISRSLRFNSADSTHLTRTPAGAGNQTTWTWSGWVKKTTIGATSTVGECKLFGASTTASNFVYFMFSDNTENALTFAYFNGTSHVFRLTTSAVFRDLSAWCHIVLAYDSTQATSNNRVKLYINGTQVTVFGTETYPSQNSTTFINSTNTHYLGQASSSTSGFYNGYLADVRFIDGQALTPSSFGETDATTGVWVPKAYTGTYGTNGFWLKFDDNSGTTSTTLGKDSSGNSNNWTPNNFSVTAGAGNDSLVDSPTNYGTDTGAGGEVRGNYATLNPLSKDASTTLANGNLDVTGQNSGAKATIYPDSGKWYWEVTITDPYVGSNGSFWGSHGVASPSWAGANADAAFTGLFVSTSSPDNPGVYQQGTRITTSTTFANNDVLGFAFDATANTLAIYRNNTQIGSTATVASTSKVIVCYMNGTAGDPSSATYNFGQRPFAYTAPSGFKALNTHNLPTPAIGASSTTLADDYFNTIVYTGNGSSPRTVSGVGFQPDLVWVKNRSTSLAHTVHDVLRGTGSNKALYTNSTAGESGGDTNLYGYLSAFTSDGFTATAGTSSQAYFNTNNESYVAWAWRANAAGSTNNAGSIQSTVSANTTAGISLVGYTGTGANATVGHGLGVAPKMVIVKNRQPGATYSWVVWHTSLSATQALELNSTAAASTSATTWNSTAPTSTVFSIGTNGASNESTKTFIAYCFAEIAGFSKIGSYTGNASTDGPFVYCGFRPRYILIKNSSAVQGWAVNDAARSTYNVVDAYLTPSSSGAEGSGYAKVDILSNGFKVRDADAFINGSTNTMIFMAFAENPFNYSRAR